MSEDTNVVEADGAKAGKRRKLIVFVIAAVVLLLGIGVIYSKDSLFVDPAKDPGRHFKDCKVLAEKCLDITTCAFNVYCGDGTYSACKIYDCGSTYGVYTRGTDGSANFNNENKPVEKAVETIRESCSGKMRILSQNCVSGRLEIKVKLETKGACEIESFATKQGDSAAANDFIRLEDGTYGIAVYNCDTVTEIIPAATGGIGLSLEQA